MDTFPFQPSQSLRVMPESCFDQLFSFETNTNEGSLAAAVPSRLRPVLAQSVAPLFVATFLRVYATDRHHLSDPLDGHAPMFTAVAADLCRHVTARSGYAITSRRPRYRSSAATHAGSVSPRAGQSR